MSPFTVISTAESSTYVRLFSLLAWVPFLAAVKDEGKIIIKLDLGRIIEMIIIGVTVAAITAWLFAPTKSKIDRIHNDIYNEETKK